MEELQETDWALVKRINCRLKNEDQQLRKTRGYRAYLDLGDFYIRDFRRNWVVATHVDPEELAKELGIL